MSQMTRILIAEDHRIMRNSLSRLIDSQHDLMVVGHASNGAVAVEMADILQPDIIVMDYGMPQMNGVEATRQIVESHPEIRVIGFSMHDDGPDEEAMLQAGASIHVSKSRSTVELLACIRELVGCTG